ncbi:COG4315 family predicted lipoprotein [Pseudooceanicola sp. C21-150M6]|uniref:COG4315 family predicted lipoprotein n=1 Tax=Pseudooceanicola sp. C21-150M6 TaxID=3434355 RepID=UPI003D7F9E82
MSATVLAAAATGALADQQGALVQTAKLGDALYLVDVAKMTLYTFDKDADGQSNCYDMCAKNWPPLIAAEGVSLPAGYATTTRKDGAMQVTYKDQPLYLWVKDMKPGQQTGEGVNGVWHIARP